MDGQKIQQPKKSQTKQHWADFYASLIVLQQGQKKEYTLASGITPSGVVHIGNFRELITVDLVTKALKSKGYSVRFIFSWDDYDVFRKVPLNMPHPEQLEKYLRFPLTQVPDTTGEYENYAEYNKEQFKKYLPTVGIFPEFLNQTQKYQKSEYAEQIKFALEHKQQLIDILNIYRGVPLTDQWWPISIFSRLSGTDEVEILSWDGNYHITYYDRLLKQQDTIDLRTTGNTKLVWRVDWPMRWVFEHVDFEPAGKDHHSQGGSFDTAKKIVSIFGGTAPTTLKYDFIAIKGIDGKMSSSSGQVISLEQVLQVYTPEMVRYLFAASRPDREFAISFDLDVIKWYEDFDRLEKLYDQNPEQLSEKQKRIYQLSQIDPVASEQASQYSFRQLANLVQIYLFDIDQLMQYIGSDNKKLRQKAQCASFWVQHYAPEEFCFQLRKDFTNYQLTDQQKQLLTGLTEQLIPLLKQKQESLVSQALYDLAKEYQWETKTMFEFLYELLINKKQGPRLAQFLCQINPEWIEQNFQQLTKSI